MTRRRTLAAALLALFVAGSSAPAFASDAPATVSTERACVFLGSNPADRQYFCVSFPWPL